MQEVIYDTPEGPITKPLEEAPMEALIALAETGNKRAQEIVYKRMGATPDELAKIVLEKVVKDFKEKNYPKEKAE